MTPVDRLIDAVFAWEASKLRNLMNLAYKREADAALRATCEQVLADLTMADAEMVEAVGTLRRQRATLESELLHQRVYVQGRDVLVAHLEQRIAEAEAASAKLRELAQEGAHERHDHSNLEGLLDGHSVGFLPDEYEICSHPDCVLVRAPHS